MGAVLLRRRQRSGRRERPGLNGKWFAIDAHLPPGEDRQRDAAQAGSADDPREPPPVPSELSSGGPGLSGRVGLLHCVLRRGSTPGRPGPARRGWREAHEVDECRSRRAVELFAPSLVEVTTRRLRDEILSGALEPGERLIEEQICQRFSISRAPLREALRLLAQQGLVEHLPRRGARVATWSEEDIRQLFEIRAVLERHAVTTALPLPTEPGIDPLAEVRRHWNGCGCAEKRRRRTRQGRRAPCLPRGHRRAGRQSPTGPRDGADPAQAAAPDGRQPRLEAPLIGPGEGLRRHEELLTALETNDPASRARGAARTRRPAVPAASGAVRATGSATGSPTARARETCWSRPSRSALLTRAVPAAIHAIVDNRPHA